MEIRVLESGDDIETAFPVMRQLRPHLDVGEFAGRVVQMQREKGYVLVGAIVDGVVRGVGGFYATSDLAHDRYVYIDDLVTDDAARSGGVGRAILEWIEEHARTQGVGVVRLDSGVQRFGAHRFYLRQRYDIVCHHFRKEL